jgi:hypothetical protein
MFGLPWSTTLLAFAFPLLWVAYTLGFLALSREWPREDSPEGPARARPTREEER